MNWIDAKITPAPALEDVLLFAEGEIMIGWNEAVLPDEEPCYWAARCDCMTCTNLDEVTHWMPFPPAPEEKA